MEMYRRQGESTAKISKVDKLPPHVYQTADTAYRAMLRGMEDLRMSKRNISSPKAAATEEASVDQSILVSGESGAGKTVTTKIVLNYFAVLSRRLVQKQATLRQQQANNGDIVLDLHAPHSSPSHASHTTSAALTEDVSIEQQVLQSNPILEAFGNARTIRNDNSSRFGKFIEVRFDALGKVTGGSIESYLLEKVRLITPGKGERNYHIFYQLLSAVFSSVHGTNTTEDIIPNTDIKEWHLYDIAKSARNVEDLYDAFQLLNCTGVYTRRDEISDEVSHYEMMQAMQIVHFESATQNMLLRMVSAVLYAGNVKFVSMEEHKNDTASAHSEGCVMVEDEYSTTLATLLGVSFSTLAQSLTRKTLTVNRETVIKELTVHQSYKALHALIQSLYSGMFDYIVLLINQSIDVGNKKTSQQGQRGASRKQPGAFIGVLDIFGFEVFQTNNYEQLCINYTNETLQQQFNKYVFKLEQLEYEKEGILWKFIPFPDNADVIELIDSRRPPGVLALLDEQCMLPKSTDEQLYRYLCQTFEPTGGLVKSTSFGAKKSSNSDASDATSNTKRFQVFPLQRPNHKFSILHYAGLVEYTVHSWLEKNRDELPLSTNTLLQSSNFPLVSDIRMFLRLQTGDVGSVNLPSVGAQFAKQLRTLRARIDGTAPHYIRCLKPNDLLIADEFQPKNIVEQLRYGGVLEAVRVSRAGYPTRYSHRGFLIRYTVLQSSQQQQQTKSKKEIEMLQDLIQDVACQIWCMQHPNNNNNTSTAKPSNTSSNTSSNGSGGWWNRLTGGNNSTRTLSSNATGNSTNVSLSGMPSPRTLSEYQALDFATQCAIVGMQVGRSKVFLRKEAFDAIEAMRTARFYRSAQLVQSLVRRFVQRRKYQRTLVCIVRAQSCVRMFLAKLVRREKVQWNSSILLQTQYRRYAAQKSYRITKFRTLSCITRIQRFYRQYILQSKVVVNHSAATIVQSCARQWVYRTRYRTLRYSTIRIQTQYRAHSARLLYRATVLHNLKLRQAEEQRLAEELERTKARLAAEAAARREKERAEQAEQQRIAELARKLKSLENARVELWRNIQSENWSMVEHIVHTTPDIVQAVEPSSGEVALHSLVRHASVWPLLIDYCLVQYPNALLHKDLLGSVPLHHAVAHDNIAACEILYHAYTQGVYECDKKGRIPLHVACEFDAVDCVKFLLEKAGDTASVEVMNQSKGLALHVACKYGAGIGVITALLSENFSAAKKTDANGDLPLHLLLRNGSNVEAVCVKTLLTCYSTGVSRADVNGDLPLLLALKHQCKGSVFNLLLLQFPSAAHVLDCDEHTPLFLALLHGADDRTILSLLNHAPEYATVVDKSTKLLPIQVATENSHSALVVHSLLKRDMPIDMQQKVQAQLLPNHHYSWNHILTHTSDLYHAVVTKVLASCTQPQVLALAHVEGPDGKIALATATPVCKHEIRVMLRLFHTLEIVNQRPAYTNPLSDTQIFYALRYPPPSHAQGGLDNNKFQVLHEDFGDNRMANDLESLDNDNMTVNTAHSNVSLRSQRSAMSLRSHYSVEEKLRRIHKEKGQQVIAKLTSRSDVVERELRIRKNFRLSRNYIPVIFSVHHTVQHAAYSEAMAEPGFCITMEGADATAENYMLDMRNAGIAFSAKNLKKIGVALLHMHEKGLVHGDFGTHNIGKFGKNKWKLLGVGGSYVIDSSSNNKTDPRRGFYHPPETIDLDKVSKAVSSSKRLLGISRSGHDNNGAPVHCVKSIVADPTLDIWAFGNVVYEAFVGAPLSPYICRGKRAMDANEYAKLGKWSDSRLKKSLDQLSESNKFRDVNEIRLAKDLLAKIFTRKPQHRLQTMREVLEHDLFASASSTKSIPQAGR